jgi:hypothetical protein
VDVRAGVLRVAGAAPEYAAPPAGTALWLDATRGVATNASGQVIRWSDLSGNGRHAASTNGPAADAAIGGTAALRFARNSKHYLACGGLRNMTNLTAFIVYRVASFPNEIMALLAEGSANASSLGNSVHINVETAKKFVYYIAGTTPNATGTSVLSEGETVISEILDDRDSWKIYKNGTENGGAARANPQKRLNDFMIGAWNTSRYFDGSIGEIIIYDRALDAAERDAAYTYLNAKWREAEPPAFTNLLAVDAEVSVAAGAAVDFSGQRQTLALLAGGGCVTGGTLAVTGAVAPGGVGQIGALTVAQTALSGTLAIEVDGAASDRLCAAGDFDLSGLTLTVVEPERLLRTADYVVAVSTGNFTAPFAGVAIPQDWKISYTDGHQVKLVHRRGTMIGIR